MKYLKEIVLSVAPYKTVKLGVSEADDFKKCDKELLKELDDHPAVRDLNKEEVRKVLK
jgi:hypothetical protein